MARSRALGSSWVASFLSSCLFLCSYIGSLLFLLSISTPIFYFIFPYSHPLSPSSLISFPCSSTLFSFPVLLIFETKYFPDALHPIPPLLKLTHLVSACFDIDISVFDLLFCTVSFVNQIPAAFVPAISPETGCNEFGQSWGVELFFTYATLTLYVIPLMVIIPCYTKIAQRMTKKTPGSTTSSDPRRKKTIIWIFVVVVLFILMWLPLHVVHLWMAFHPIVTAQTPLYIQIHTAANVLIFINSSVNPYLYAFIVALFRKHLIEIVQCCCCGVVWLLRKRKADQNVSASVTTLSSHELSHASINQA